MVTEPLNGHSAAVSTLLGLSGLYADRSGRFSGRCPFCKQGQFVWNPQMNAFFCDRDGCVLPGTGERLMELLKARAGIPVSSVESERVRWLWEGRIPFGKITMLDGDPGLGKSLMSLEFAARLSRGFGFPDDEHPPHPPANTLLVAAEDGLADTIRPRLEACGADLCKIFALNKPARIYQFPKDLQLLGAMVQLYDARLVIIDPLFAHLDGTVNSYKDSEIRSLVMAPLGKIAESTGAAVLLIRHPTKSDVGNILHKGGGSIGIIGAARSGLYIGRDGQRRFVRQPKSNLGREMRDLYYEIVAVGETAAISWQ